MLRATYDFLVLFRLYMPSLYSLCALEGPHIWLILPLGLVDKYPVYGVRLTWCSYTQAIPEVSMVFSLAP